MELATCGNVIFQNLISCRCHQPSKIGAIGHLHFLLLLTIELISFQQRAQYQDQLARKRYDDQLVQQVSYCNGGIKRIVLNELFYFLQNIAKNITNDFVLQLYNGNNTIKEK